MTDDFWEWFPKAYRDGDIGDEPRFTKYNMEVAFAAGAEAEAKRMWQGLTGQEIKDCEKQAMVNGSLPFEQRFFFARALEAKLKEKNT